MVALATLGVVALIALLTPLAPLQPPDVVRTELQYAAPTAAPLWLRDFQFDPDGPAKSRRLADELRAQGASLEGAERARTLAASRDALHAPFVRAGFAELDPLSRRMVQWRRALWGERQLNSLCGRDQLGRDVLSRVCWGARLSLLAGLVATAVSLTIGVAYGAMSGYLGGRVDEVMMRLVDVLYSIPFVFVVIFLLTIINSEGVAATMQAWGVGKLTVFFVVVGAISWLTMARVVRGQVLSLKTELFVEAARSLGASRRRIIVRHMLPNLASIVLVYLTLTIPRVMLFEAFLSFLGLGVEPPDVSWGLLARDGIEALTPVKVYWWLVVFPGAALGATMLSLNFLGDGLRDAFDPRLAQRRTR